MKKRISKIFLIIPAVCYLLCSGLVFAGNGSSRMSGSASTHQIILTPLQEALYQQLKRCCSVTQSTQQLVTEASTSKRSLSRSTSVPNMQDPKRRTIMMSTLEGLGKALPEDPRESAATKEERDYAVKRMDKIAHIMGREEVPVDPSSEMPIAMGNCRFPLNKFINTCQITQMDRYCVLWKFLAEESELYNSIPEETIARLQKLDPKNITEITSKVSSSLVIKIKTKKRDTIFVYV